MTDGQIWAVMLRKRIFTPAELLDSLNVSNYMKPYIKERVRSIIASQLKVNALKMIDKEIPVLAVPDITEEEIENYKVICMQCGTKFFRKNSKNQFCSEECKKEHYKEYHKRRREKENMRVDSKRRWTEEELQIALSMREKGYTYREIAEKIGRSRQSVVEKFKSQRRLV